MKGVKKRVAQSSSIEIKEFVSPFSYFKHEWDLKWKIIRSNQKYDRPNENRTEKEEKALEAIATVGVIGGLQLKNLFRISKQQLKSMENRHLVVRHSISQNGREIPIYTVGKYGANKIMPEYAENYWLEMNIVNVLKCLSFFQFCYLFPDVEIIPAPAPFTAGIYLNNQRKQPFYIYVVRDGIKDLLLYLKWKRQFTERIFIITEKLEYINSLEIFMETDQPLKLRVILDEQIKKRELKLYYYDKNDPQKWVKN